MKNRICILAATFCCLTTLGYADIQESTLADQTKVEVTVYNNNLGLIKDTRDIQLPKGEGELRFMDVAAHINPVTVHVKSLNLGDQFQVLEQNYEYDLMNPNKLLNKYVGKSLKLVDTNRYQDRTDVVEAKLLSFNDNRPIYEIDGEIHLGHAGYQVLPQIPENLIAQPTLTWLYGSDTNKEHQLEVSYLTGNMSWRADYVLVLNQDDTQADLSGWVTVNNNSGAVYENAQLKLVAGEVNRAREEVMHMDMAMEARSFSGARRKQFEEKGFFEYHIYDLQRPTTLKNNQTKQISLLEASDVEISKEYLVYGNKTYFNRLYRENNPKQPVNVQIKFENKEDNALGMPLPKGIVRLYKEDDEGKLQFVGEDNVDHTPKDEEISLKVGEAFDIVAERKQTDFRQITTRKYETEWEVTLRNHKEEDIMVSVIEPMPGTWYVTKASTTYLKKDAFTLQFDVPVPKDGEVKITYRIEVGI